MRPTGASTGAPARPAWGPGAGTPFSAEHAFLPSLHPLGEDQVDVVARAVQILSGAGAQRIQGTGEDGEPHAHRNHACGRRHPHFRRALPFTVVVLPWRLGELV